MKETTQPHKSMSQYVPMIVIAIVIGVASFFCGMKYQQRRGISFNGRQFTNAQGQFGRGAGQGLPNGNRVGGGRPVTGEVFSIDEKSMTVKMPDGSSKIVLLSEATTYAKSDTGSKSDIVTGVSVGVFGMENPDGSVTAQNIQLNPTIRGTNATTSGTPVGR